MTIRSKFRMPDAPREYSQPHMNKFARLVEHELNHLAQPVASGYSPSNYTATRSLNAGTATTGDVANVLATLLQDFIDSGNLAE